MAICTKGLVHAIFSRGARGPLARRTPLFGALTCAAALWRRRYQGILRGSPGQSGRRQAHQSGDRPAVHGLCRGDQYVDGPRVRAGGERGQHQGTFSEPHSGSSRTLRPRARRRRELRREPGGGERRKRNVADPQVLAVFGTRNSAAAKAEIPITDAGGLSMISATNTNPDLTKGGAAWSRLAYDPRRREQLFPRLRNR